MLRTFCSFITGWLRKNADTGDGKQRADTGMAARAARDCYSRQGTVGSTGPDVWVMSSSVRSQLKKYNNENFYMDEYNNENLPKQV